MDQDLHILGGIVVDLSDLDLPFAIGSKNRVDDRFRICSVWDLGDRQCLFVDLADLRPQPNLSSS